MIRLHFQEVPEELLQGIHDLQDHLRFLVSNSGTSVTAIQRPGNIEIFYEQSSAKICYDQKIHFFRALGLLIEMIQSNPSVSFTEEEPQFSFNGMMFDVSRNAVLTVKSIKTLLNYMAVMGLNGFMLYTEDVYTVPDQPYFGYMRGKYSQEELKEIDDYADRLGIEVIPCIQTLAHVAHVLKWDFEMAYTDTSDIFLVGAEATYVLIEQMIKAISSPFRTKRIHIGMDEAFFLGAGQSMQRHGYRDRFEMMNEHLDRVLAIVQQLQLKPMMWSDMYFRMGSPTKDYYDKQAQIPQDIIDHFNQKSQLVYWDYYHHDEEDYLYYIQKHQEFGAELIFAGGLWTWNGITPHYRQMTKSTNAGLNACKQSGIREVFATIWADNGAETSLLAALPGMQLYAEHGYHAVLNESQLRARFHFCVGAHYDDFMLLGELNTLSVNDIRHLEGYFPSNPSKYLLWQDVLLGLFDKHIEGLAVAEHYRALADKIRMMAYQHESWSIFFSFYAQLAEVLSVKCDMGLRLTAYYKANDHEKLGKCMIHEFPQLEQNVRLLRKLHRDLWFYTNKANGWEVIDIRYGGLLVRLDSASYRLQKYLTGEIERLEELEEERLYYDGGSHRQARPSGFCNYYHDIVSVGHLSEFTRM